MARRCDICGKGPITGHRISHSHHLTKRRWLPNLQRVRVIVDGRPQRLMVCTNCIKSGRVQKVPPRIKISSEASPQIDELGTT
ncbi:50S ribosomal protein L28 [candidate division KSB1 bacterium]|nr:50S ribosomal protein L28 [candidate division KSB1 bacterium]